MAKPTVKSIERQIAKLKAMAEKLAAKDKTPAIRQIVALMTKNGVTVAEVTAALAKGKPAAKRARGAKSAKPAAKRGTVAPKYRDPNTGATWTGRGRTPVWVLEAEKAGATRQSFLIAPAA